MPQALHSSMRPQILGLRHVGVLRVLQLLHACAPGGSRAVSERAGQQLASAMDSARCSY
jgi:hypothetical protein